MKKNALALRSLPSVDKLLHAPQLAEYIANYGRPFVTYAVRAAIADARLKLGSGDTNRQADEQSLIRDTENAIELIAKPSLKPVINATGIALHTNLGRTPMAETIFREIIPIATGYSNIEFDLKKGLRGHRNAHVAGLLRYLTGAQDAIVVNNNAAAIVLTLNTFAHNKEVIISRGELIEIGGAFRIPDIMAAAGVRMKEVGTTNRTRLSDYQKAISSETGLIVKAHTSNYTISGFIETVSIRDVAGLAKKKRIPFLYDIGSGLLRKPAGLPLEGEPDVRSAIAAGADLVCFSADKLLGGPQAGIIAGKARLVRALAQAPMMRALRVGKLTLAALSAVCRLYLNDETLKAHNPIFSLLHRSDAERKRMAQNLYEALTKKGIAAEIIESTGRCGGGTLPDLMMHSFGVRLIASTGRVREREAAAVRLFHDLLTTNQPVCAVLREGRIVFDVFTLWEKDVETIADSVACCTKRPDAQ